jgi:D-tyrosyl-tRNA(Tyr) deacylase
MRAVLQRVSEASVTVGGREVARIGRGLLVLLGVAEGDTPADLEVLAARVPVLRVFDDADGKLNLSLVDVGGQVLVVSQFTLLADTTKGRRPSYTRAMRPETAAPMVDAFVALLRALGLEARQGVFGAHMQVALVNDGPVTLVLDTRAVN